MTDVRTVEQLKARIKALESEKAAQLRLINFFQETWLVARPDQNVWDIAHEFYAWQREKENE